MSVLYVTLLVVATLIWGYIFYKKDYHPQPIKVIAQIFGIGLFAMVPIFAYKYIYQNYLPMLSEFQIFRPILDSALLSGILFFVMNLVLLSIILFIITGTLTLVLTLFKRETIRNIKEALSESEFGFITVSMFVGLLIYCESFIQSTFNIQLINTIVGTVLFLAIIEEYVKHLMVKFVDDKKLKDIDDAITLSIMVGLAFGLVETFMYAVVIGDFSVIIYRALFSIPIHLIASGIFGYFYGLSHFAKPLTKATVGEKTYKFNIKWMHKVLALKRSTIYEDEKIVEGLGIAVLFHTGCNVLFELDLAYVVVPIIIAGLIFVSFLYKESHILYKLIHAH